VHVLQPTNIWVSRITGKISYS